MNGNKTGRATNTFSKVFHTYQKSTLLRMVQAEEARLQENRDSNTSKQLKKLDLFKQIVNSIDNNVKITAEGVRGNGDIREFNMLNIGSVTECIVKYHLSKVPTKRLEKEVAGAYDLKFGTWNVEIKASLAGTSLASPSRCETTLLINTLGAFLIKKNDVEMYVNKAGRLPYNKPCGRRYKALSAALGYGEGGAEE